MKYINITYNKLKPRQFSKLALTLLACFLSANIVALAGESEDFRGFFAPRFLNDYEYIHSIGLSVAKLPKIIVDDQINQAPLLVYTGKLGLPYNLKAIGEFKTNYLTNHIQLGTSWTYQYGKTLIEPGIASSYWIGKANFAYYNTSVTGYMIYPSLAIAYDINNTRLALKTTASFMLSSSKKVDDIETQVNKKQLTGFTTEIIVEEPFIGKSWLALGFKVNYSKYFYPSWLAFNSTNKWLFIPEFQVAYNL